MAKPIRIFQNHHTSAVIFPIHRPAAGIHVLRILGNMLGDVMIDPITIYTEADKQSEETSTSKRNAHYDGYGES